MARKYYDVLQIHPEASSEEIQSAYRRLARRYHPDHNASPEAASQMTAINEAYEALHDESATESARRDGLTTSIMDAARGVILRHGWTAIQDDGKVTVFEIGKPVVRIALTGRLTAESLNRLARQHRTLMMVLAVHLEMPVVAGLPIAVIDLMRAEPHGAPIPDGPCKSLLAGFL